jgi:predicted MFS family arabinose efflux permease
MRRVVAEGGTASRTWDRDVAGFAALAFAAAWNAGNIGPATGAMAAGLDVSLAAIGVAGGTLFFIGLVAAKLGAARVVDRIGSHGAVRSCCGLAVIGNVIVAAAPVLAVVAAGRLVAGLSLGLTLVMGPVLARRMGGVGLVGIFGSSVTVGTAAALGIGSLMRSAGISWRADFVLAAAIAAAALLILPRPPEARLSAGSVLALMRRGARRAPAWRLELLFLTSLGLPYVVGIWLIPYLTRDVGFPVAFAGLLAFVLFATSAVLRREGARLEASGTSLSLLGGAAPLLAGLGLALLAVSGLEPVAIAGVILAGMGFAIPYAAMYDEAQQMFPDARMAAVGVFSVGANLMPALVLPPIGAAIDAGRGELAMFALAAASLLAGLVNLRPAVAPEREHDDRRSGERP